MPDMPFRTYGGPDARDPGLRNAVVLGPCPGCDAWQLDYTEEVSAQWVKVGFDSEVGQPRVILDLWYAVVEDALREHMLECPHLRDLVQEYGL